MKIRFYFIRPIAIFFILISSMEVFGSALSNILKIKMQSYSYSFSGIKGNRIQKIPSGFNINSNTKGILEKRESTKNTDEFDEDSVFLKDKGSRKFVIKSLPYFAYCRVFKYKDFAPKMKLDSFKTHKKGFQYYIEPTEEDAGYLYLINAKKSKIFKVSYSTQFDYEENFDFGFHKWKYDSKGNCKCISYQCRLISCNDYPVFKIIEISTHGCAA